VDVAAAAPRLASLIFQTLPIYSDRRSQASVERAITKALKRETAFVKAFAGALVQACAKPGSVSASVAGLVRYKLLKWSCLLLRERGDAIVGVRAAFSRLVVAQGTLLTVALGDEPRLKRASLHAVNEMLGMVPSLAPAYLAEIKSTPVTLTTVGIAHPLLTYFLESKAREAEGAAAADGVANGTAEAAAAAAPGSTAEAKAFFVETYSKLVLSSRERPPHVASEAFAPLLHSLEHSEFKGTLFPTAAKMLKRNPELIMDAVGYLLSTVRLDLSAYAPELLPTLALQARHQNAATREEAIGVFAVAAKQCSDSDSIRTMFAYLKGVLAGKEGKLTSAYQKVGVYQTLRALSAFSAPGPNAMAPAVAADVAEFLMTAYAGDTNEEVLASILSALGEWLARTARQAPAATSAFVTARLAKEKETLRRCTLRCMRLAFRNPHVREKLVPCVDVLVALVKSGVVKPTCEFESTKTTRPPPRPLSSARTLRGLALVKSGVAKPTMRLDGVYALLLAASIAALDLGSAHHAAGWGLCAAARRLHCCPRPGPTMRMDGVYALLLAASIAALDLGSAHHAAGWGLCAAARRLHCCPRPGPTMRMDGVYALLLAASIAALDLGSGMTVGLGGGPSGILFEIACITMYLLSPPCGWTGSMRCCLRPPLLPSTWDQPTMRMDGVYALLLAASIAALDLGSRMTVGLGGGPSGILFEIACITMYLLSPPCGWTGSMRCCLQPPLLPSTWDQPTMRLDGVYVLLLAASIAALDLGSESPGSSAGGTSSSTSLVCMDSKHAVYRHFKVPANSVGENGTKVCAYCNFTFVGGVHRCAQHITSWNGMRRREVHLCTAAPKTARDAVKALYESKLKAREAKRAAEIAAVGAVNGRGSDKKKSRMTDFYGDDAACANQAADEAISLFFAALHVPEHHAVHPLWWNVVSSIQRAGPNYVAPKRRYIGGAGRAKCRQRIETALAPISASWRRDGVTVASDIFSDKAGRPQANVLLINDSGAVFVESIDTKMEMKTGGYIAGILRPIIEKVGPENVVALCFDGGSNYAAACRVLMREYPHIEHIPCATHVLDLLMEDIGKKGWAKDIVTRGDTLISFVRNHHFTRGYMRSPLVNGGKGKQVLKPAGTRFGTNYIAINRLCELTEDIRDFLDEHAEGVLTSDEVGYIREIVQDRWDNGLACNLHVIGRILYPTNQEEGIFRTDLECTRVFKQYVSKHHGDKTVTRKDGVERRASLVIQEGLNAFLNLQGSFGMPDAIADRQAVKEGKMTAVDWWTWHGTEHPELTTMACRAITQPVSASP
ncbi:unnamed protein product, partial [Closterium sp. NIES-65]